MKTVHEISSITGISVRTLHYYDEIGLLKPTGRTEAGYRLYDDKALETLQQILFFRALEVPLKKIRAVLDDPGLGKEQILQTQRTMLMLEKQRLERLISSIDGILKGDNTMDFAIFSREEVEAVYRVQLWGMTPEVKKLVEEQYSGEQGYHDYFMQQMGGEDAQKAWQKMVEWCGGRDNAADVATHPLDPQVARAYGNRLERVLEKLQAHRGEDVHSFAVKEIIGEYEFVARQLLRFKDMRGFMLELAQSYAANPEFIARMEGRFGPGSAAFLAEAIRAYCGAAQ